MAKIPVKALYEYCEMMLRDEWGYIWGYAGSMFTEAKYKAICAKYSEDDATYGMAVRYGSRWIGHMVTDCSGVMVYIWKKFNLSIYHGVNSMVKQRQIVDLTSTPFPGAAALVYKDKDNDYSHIGIVAADGQIVYESKGTRYGFVTSKVTDAKWNVFGRFKDVDYTGGEEMKTPYKAIVTLTKGTLNIRSGPGKNFDVIGKFGNGQEVVVVTHGTEWDFVKNGSLNGYVSNQYLTPVEEIDTSEENDHSEEMIKFELTKADAEELERLITKLESILNNAKIKG